MFKCEVYPTVYWCLWPHASVFLWGLFPARGWAGCGIWLHLGEHNGLTDSVTSSDLPALWTSCRVSIIAWSFLKALLSHISCVCGGAIIKRLVVCFHTFLNKKTLQMISHNAKHFTCFTKELMSVMEKEKMKWVQASLPLLGWPLDAALIKLPGTWILLQWNDTCHFVAGIICWCSTLQVW